MNQAAKQYLKEVKGYLPCTASQKKRYLAELEVSIHDYVRAHPNCEPDELCAAFGAPEASAEAYISDLSSKEFKKKASTKKVVLIGVIVGIIVAIIAAGALVRIAIDHWNITNGYYYDVVYELPSGVPSELSVYGVY